MKVNTLTQSNSESERKDEVLLLFRTVLRISLVCGSQPFADIGNYLS